MILGIGVDIAEVDRIKRSISEGNHFKKRVFTEVEQNYCDSIKNSAESYAARYAAKEAFFKALGTGWRGELKFRIEKFEWCVRIHSSRFFSNIPKRKYIKL